MKERISEVSNHKGERYTFEPIEVDRGFYVFYMGKRIAELEAALTAAKDRRAAAQMVVEKQKRMLTDHCIEGGSTEYLLNKKITDLKTRIARLEAALTVAKDRRAALRGKLSAATTIDEARLQKIAELEAELKQERKDFREAWRKYKELEARLEAAYLEVETQTAKRVALEAENKTI